MLKKFRDQSEVHISLLLGLFFVVLGIFILFNTGRIRGAADGDPVDEAEIETVWDLVNAFFLEVMNMLSILIGDFPIIAGILMILFGVFMFMIGKTVRDTTRYDGLLSFFFMGLSLFLFIITTILMMQVYGWWALLFLIAFMVHLLYNIFNEYLDPRHRKEHYMIIMFFYGIAYFFTQNAVYANIEDALSPTDVLSVNMFFALVLVLSLLALWVGVFLSKSKNFLKKPKARSGEEMSRSSRRGMNKLNPNQYLGFSEKIYQFRNSLLTRIKDFLEIGMPGWLKVNYIELVLGLLVLVFIGVEFNNRQGVFTEGYFRLSQMSHLYEWINLFLTLVLALAYLFFTVTNLWKNIHYHRQMIVIIALWLKLTVSLFVTVYHDVELSLFILPFNIVLVLLTTPLVLFSIFKEFNGGTTNDRNKKA
jgi:MFS family permease